MTTKMNETEKTTKGTIIRTIVLAVALVNMFLTISGHSVLPFDEDDINEIVSTVFMVVVSIWTWWKNNSFTPEAKKADKYMDSLKKEG